MAGHGNLPSLPHTVIVTVTARQKARPLTVDMWTCVCCADASMPGHVHRRGLHPPHAWCPACSCIAHVSHECTHASNVGVHYMSLVLMK